MDLYDTLQAAAARAVTSFHPDTTKVARKANNNSCSSSSGSSLVTGGTVVTDCDFLPSAAANRNSRLEEQHYRPAVRSPVPRRHHHHPRQQRLGSCDSAGSSSGGGRRDKHTRDRSREEAAIVVAGSSGRSLEMTTATMEMLTTATTTTPATGNSSSIASTTAAGGGSGSGGVPFSTGASLDEMMRGVDYSNLSGVVPLLEEVDGNLTTVSQHSNDSIERTLLPGSSSSGGQPHGHAHHQKGHSRGSSAPQAYDRITTKIACTKELIRKEQEARDSNVNEYLKLAANADKNQLQRIKAVFEKKNQKSANNISQLQKKLESYNKRYKDMQQTQQKQAQQQQSQQQVAQQQHAAAAASLLLQQQQQQHQQQQAILLTGGSQTLPPNLQQLAVTTNQQQQQSFLQPREMLRDVGQGLRNVGGNIRHGVTGLSATVISKPRKFAHLIRNKFGSADNINQLTSTWYTGSAADSELSGMDVTGSAEGQQTTPNASGPGGGGQSNQHNTSISDSEGRRTHGATQGHQHHQQLHGVSSGHRHHTGGPGPGGKYSEHDSECSSVTSDSIPLGSDKHRLSCSQRCVNYKALNELREEYQKLKERLDRVELVQKEVTELSMALENERYRADRLEEQINDLSELHQNERENLKQAIADLEEKVQYQSDERLRDVNEILENCQTRISKMEQLSQQQYVTVEGIYNSNARAVVVKLINVVLTVLQVILLLVATVAGIIVPFLKTRLRVLTTLLCTLVLIAIVRQWPDVRDTGVHLIRILRSQVVSDTGAT
ncbi:transmembrane and coiled-coil domains protein 1 [Anopheles maculipalpis]|uniref:transmembrane and coiled-coil domains protein 1 n=1 Tax=Anopheles maculipalpis TaxID=1496333 RepID=UPI002158D560|nr:transmembrane and coiled-coil domains protein 1 [Anopheles maculipalpis]